MAGSDLDGMSSDRIAPLVVAIPPVAAAVAWIGMLIATAVTGAHPIWSLAPGNIAEAAAMRDLGALVRFAGEGGDINRPAEVRGRLILDDAAALTPLEAAAGARDESLVAMVFELGATPDARVWNRAFCISDADRVRDILRAHRPEGAVEDCGEQP